MPTVAEQLKAAREAKKLTIQQVADLTKIRTDHLRALENGNFDAFSAPIYIRGSVKNYAMTLKLDVPTILADLEAELKRTEKFSEPPPLMEETKSPLDYVMFLLSKVNGHVAAMAGGILGIILIVWFARHLIHRHHENDSTPDVAPAVYQSGTADQTLPLPKK